MNFDFSEDLQPVRAEARAFLRAHAAGSARRAMNGDTGFDPALWHDIAKLGWIGAAIPEQYGGTGMGDEALCVLAEEIGHAIPAIPFASSAYLAAQAILCFGSETQKRTYLPRLADGSLIFCFALAEGPGAPQPNAIATIYRDGTLSGAKQPVIDGRVAHFGIVAARNGAGITLAVTDLDQSGVVRDSLPSLDPSRDTARLTLQSAAADLLPGATGFSAVEHLLDRAAVLFAFEQLGGAQACLEMAREYALQRHAFGRPIGSFQAIKHKLADVYIEIELARSNAYYGAWALAAGAPDLTGAAAAARVAATHAFELASAENIQTHGGMGFTWESDCHLFYRRAKHLSLAIGAAPYWKERLVTSIEQRNAA